VKLLLQFAHIIFQQAVTFGYKKGVSKISRWNSVQFQTFLNLIIWLGE